MIRLACKIASYALAVGLVVLVWHVLRIQSLLQILATAVVMLLWRVEFFLPVLSYSASKDPAGHVRLTVSNLEASKAFYAELFIKIGATRVAEKGWATREGFGIWLIQAVHRMPAPVFEAPGLHHLCLKAISKEEVDALYSFLMEHEVEVTAAPHGYPQYTSRYYAVFFLDPDGLHLEVAYY